jgi:phosphohistidine phosphatase
MQAFEEESGMDLLLWRHAEAEDGSPDAKRKLTARGEKQARHVAEWIKRNAPKDMSILVSPATRCQQTAEALGKEFTTDKRLATNSNTANVLGAAGWPDGNKSGKGRPAVLVVGHQPTLGQIAALLLSGHEAEWTIKKGALWWFSNRTRDGETQTVLRAAIPPEIA